VLGGPCFARSLVPKPSALRRDLEAYLEYYNYVRTYRQAHQKTDAGACRGREEEESEVIKMHRHTSESVQTRSRSIVAGVVSDCKVRGHD
jgi:hypothetical protein